jgi:hypothetical protein
MQNFDLYDKHVSQRDIPFFEKQPVSTTSLPQGEHEIHHTSDELHKKASRTLFLVTFLCITSFTAGLVIGMKYLGNSKGQLVDKDTKKAMASLRSSVSSMMSGNSCKRAERVQRKVSYPESEFPYAIRIGKKVDEATTKKLVKYFVSQGQPVFKFPSARGNDLIIGPYRSKKSAKMSLQRILSHDKIASMMKLEIIERTNPAKE